MVVNIEEVRAGAGAAFSSHYSPVTAATFPSSSDYFSQIKCGLRCFCDPT